MTESNETVDALPPTETPLSNGFVASILEWLGRLEQHVSQLGSQVEQLAGRVELIPPQVRQLGVKVDDLTESIAQPRIRDLLNRFVLLYDFVDQMSRSAVPESEPARNYQVLRRQIEQNLEVSGVYAIAGVGQFDPALHKAVEIVACQTPEENGRIVSVFRPGFRTERAVLRYAEVVIKRYQPLDNAVG